MFWICRGLNDRLMAQAFVFDQSFQSYEKDKFVVVRMTVLYCQKCNDISV